MSSLSLDGGSTYIGTEVLKLEITGTSELATQQFVQQQIGSAEGGYYSIPEVDSLLSTKADTSYVVGNFYTQTQLDTSLGLKADQANTYTKTEVDSSLALKADQATTYTKAETDTALNGKIDRVSGVEQSVSSNFNVLGVLKTHTFQTNGDVDMALFRNNVLYLTLEQASISASMPVKSATINTNTINTDGDVNLNFQQNSVNFMHFDATADKIELDTALKSTSDIASTILKGETLSNYNVNGLNLDTTTNSIYIKNQTNTKIEVQSDKVIVSDPLHCNTINSNGDNDIIIQRNSVEYCKFRDSAGVRLLDFPTSGGVSANVMYGNIFANRSNANDTIFQGSNVAGTGRVEYTRYDYLNGTLNIVKPLKQDVIDTTGDVNLTVRRNAVDYFTLELDGTIKLMNFTADGGVSVNRVYGNYFQNRSFSADTIFEGSNVAGNGREEYMRYNYANQIIKMAKPLHCNRLNSDGDNDVVFQRNGVEYMTLDKTSGSRQSFNRESIRVVRW